MNWDTTNINRNSSFKSTALTITGIEEINITFSGGNTQKGYEITVKEDIIYRNNFLRLGEGTVTKKTFTILPNTYENLKKSLL